MNRFLKKNKIIKFLKKLSEAEKNHKILTYISLLFLTINLYVLRKSDIKKTIDIENYKNEVKVLKVNFENEVKALKVNLITYNRSFEDFPIPYWEKKKVGNQFVSQYFNPVYVDFFGHEFNYNRYNIIGKNNFQLGYSKDIAQRYYENDVAVAITGDDLYTTEFYKDSLGSVRKIDVLKWRKIIGKDTLVPGMVLRVYDNE